MIRLSRKEMKLLMRLFMVGINDEKYNKFMALGTGGRYTEQQKSYAFELIRKSGIRATAKILCLPRRTLQRWCRAYSIYVKRCPDWVYEWAERRRRRNALWARRIRKRNAAT